MRLETRRYDMRAKVDAHTLNANRDHVRWGVARHDILWALTTRAFATRDDVIRVARVSRDGSTSRTLRMFEHLGIVDVIAINGTNAYAITPEGRALHRTWAHRRDTRHVHDERDRASRAFVRTIAQRDIIARVANAIGIAS